MPVPRSVTDSYPAVARSIHWLIVVLVIGVFVAGFKAYGGAHSPPPGPSASAFAGAPPAPPPHRSQSPWDVHQLHKSLGLIILALTAVRLVYRGTHNYPAAPPEMPRGMVAAARINQGLLYAGFVLQPIVGLAGSGKGFSFLGMFHMPTLDASPPLIRTLHSVHVFTAWTLLGLIALHSTAALFHHYVRKDDVLRRMLPGTGRRPA